MAKNSEPKIKKIWVNWYYTNINGESFEVFDVTSSKNFDGLGVVIEIWETDIEGFYTVKFSTGKEISVSNINRIYWEGDE